MLPVAAGWSHRRVSGLGAIIDYFGKSRRGRRDLPARKAGKSQHEPGSGSCLMVIAADSACDDSLLSGNTFNPGIGKRFVQISDDVHALVRVAVAAAA